MKPTELRIGTARTKSLGRARDKADSNSPATAALIQAPVSADAQAATTDTFTTAPAPLVPSARYLKLPRTKMVSLPQPRHCPVLLDRESEMEHTL